MRCELRNTSKRRFSGKEQQTDVDRPRHCGSADPAGAKSGFQSAAKPMKMKPEEKKRGYPKNFPPKNDENGAKKISKK